MDAFVTALDTAVSKHHWSARLAIAGLSFMLLEVLLQLTLRPAVMRMLATGKGVNCTPKKLDAAASSALAKLVSTFHNAVAVPGAVLVLLDPTLRTEPLYATSPMSRMLTLFTSGYFLYDLATVLLRLTHEGIPFLVHALGCLGVFGFSVYSGYLQWFGAAFLLWEVSTIFVHVRWLLLQLGQDKTTLYVANGLTMIVFFFVFRCVLGTAASIMFWRLTAEDLVAPQPGSIPPVVVWIYRLSNCALNLLNFYWFSLMARKAWAVVVQGGNRTAVSKKSN